LIGGGVNVLKGGRGRKDREAIRQGHRILTTRLVWGVATKKSGGKRAGQEGRENKTSGGYCQERI